MIEFSVFRGLEFFLWILYGNMSYVIKEIDSGKKIRNKNSEFSTFLEFQF